MSRIVLDASAILAVINAELGHEKLTPELLAEAVTSTVNLAEVQAKLVSRGWTADEAWEDATSPVYEMVPFDAQQAKISGDLITQTRTLGFGWEIMPALRWALHSMLRFSPPRKPGRSSNPASRST